MATDDIRSRLQDRHEVVAEYCEAVRRLRQLCAEPLLPINNEVSVEAIWSATTQITEATAAITATMFWW